MMIHKHLARARRNRGASWLVSHRNTILGIALITLAFPLVLPAQSLGGSNPLTDLISSASASAQAVSKPALILGFIVGGLVVALSGGSFGRVIGYLLMGGVLVVGAARWVNWIPS